MQIQTTCCLTLLFLQGQNRTTAFSRGFYFVLVGMLAFFINIAVENGPQDPLNVYHFNLSSHDILLFVRDGLLSVLLSFVVVVVVCVFVWFVHCALQ